MQRARNYAQECRASLQRLPLIATVASAVVLMGGCAPPDQGAPPPATETRPPQSVTTVTPRQATLEETLTLSCKAVPVDAVDVATELPGLRVLTLEAEAGDTVRKGQVMARLDTAILDLQLAQLTHQRERAQEEFDRLTQMKPSGGVSLDQLSEKRLALQGFQAQYAETELRRSRAVITAPAHGWVYARNARIGQVVNAGEPLFHLARNGLVEAECELPEQYTARVRPGEPMTLSVTGQGNGSSQGTVRVLYPHIDPQRRTAPLRVSVDWHAKTLIGTWIEGQWVMARHSGPATPLTALQQDNGGHFVWVVADGVARRHAVKVVHAGATEVILDNLETNSQVVARAGSLLREGTAVIAQDGGATP